MQLWVRGLSDSRVGISHLGLHEMPGFVGNVKLFWRMWSKTVTHPESLKDVIKACRETQDKCFDF